MANEQIAEEKVAKERIAEEKAVKKLKNIKLSDISKHRGEQLAHALLSLQTQELQAGAISKPKRKHHDD